MKIHKLHVTPLQTSFLYMKKQGTEYTSQGHTMQFNFNNIFIEPFENRGTPNFTIDTILAKFKATLRVYKGKHFRKLHLNIQACRGLDKTTLCSLGHEIAAHFRILTELKIFFFCCDLTDEGFRHLLTPIGKLQCLKKLYLHVFCCPQLSVKGMSCMKSLILNKIKGLCDLSLVFSDDKTLLSGHEALPYEVDIKKRLRLLSSRAGWMKQNRRPALTNKGVFSLCQSLKRYQRSLEKLIFILPYQNPNDGTRIFFSALQKLARLKTLYLTFRYCPSLGNSSHQPSNLIKGKLTDLEYLTLDFEDCHNVPKEGFNQFGLNILPYMPKLKGLIFNSSSDQELTEAGIPNFLELILKYTTNLEDLTANIGRVENLTSQGAVNLIQKITENLSLLQKLTIDFRDILGLKKKFAPLQISKRIRELNLYFNNYRPELIPTNLEDIESLTLTYHEGFDLVERNFKKFNLVVFGPAYQNLQQFTLVISQFHKIPDKNLFHLLFVQNAEKFNNLKSLTIEMLDCTNELIDDVFFEPLISCIKNNLKSLEFLSINLNNCAISSDNRELLSLSIAKNLRNLHSLKLDYGCCYEVPEVRMSVVLDYIAQYMTELRELEVTFGVKETKRIELAKHKGLRHIPIVRIY